MTDEEFRIARERMVDEQLVPRGIKDPHVLEAMRNVPRHKFMPEDMRLHAYDDHAARIGCGQTISQPYMVAVMTQLLELQPGDRVLEVGTGSGYQTAVLAEIAKWVVSIERHADLAHTADDLLQELGYDNVTVVEGDGTRGYPPDAPYDAILVTAGGPTVPPSLRQQLAVGGRMICPTGERQHQVLEKIIRRDKDTFDREQTISCVFVPLIGEEGWAQ